MYLAFKKINISKLYKYNMLFLLFQYLNKQLQKCRIKDRSSDDVVTTPIEVVIHEYNRVEM